MTMDMWFTMRQNRAMIISLPTVPPNSTMTESGRKHDYRVMQSRQLSLWPTNKASEEGIVGTNVFPRPSCDFIIYCITKWCFTPLGNKASIFNVSQWKVNTWNFLFGGQFFRTISNTEKCKYTRIGLRDVNEHPKSKTNLFHKITIKQIAFISYFHRR